MWRHHPETAALARLVAEGVVGRLQVIYAASSFQLAAVHGRRRCPPQPRVTGRLLDGRRLLLRATPSGLSEASLSASSPSCSSGPVASTSVCRRASPARRRHCALRLRLRRPLPMSSRSSATRRAFSSTIPGTSTRPESRCAASPTARSRKLQSTLHARTSSSSRTSVAAIRGDAPLLLGRDDALGRARVIEALYQSAGSQRGTGAPNDVHAGR
jgi:hypothetical protein